MWTTCLFLIHQSLFGQRLARCQLQPLSALALNGNLRKARQVLSHVEHQGIAFADGVRDRIALHDSHRFGYLPAQLTFGSLLDNHRMPVHGVDAGIVVLTAIDAVKGDGRESPFPRAVADNVLRLAILVFDVQAEQQRRRPKGYLHLRIALALFVVETVAEEHLYKHGHVDHRQRVGDVVGVVPDGFIVVAPRRRHLVLANLAVVDGQFVKA